MKNLENIHRKTSKTDRILICIIGQKYRIITEIAAELQWKLTSEDNLWNVFWSDSVMDVRFCLNMRRFQKMNHFPGMIEICRKNFLSRNLNRMQKAFPGDYQFFPKTWCLTASYGDALSYSLNNKDQTFIVKPSGGAQGKGIYLTQSLQDLTDLENKICQIYLQKPLLIDGFKFDLRVYVLVTSIDPLRIYIYNEGIARFATTPYKKPGKDNTMNTFMHITNYSLNKCSETFSKDKETGSKRSLSRLNEILSRNGHDIVALWSSIDDIVIKTLISALPVLKHNYNALFPRHDLTSACFEILGVDIFVDENLKPWLLEVNHSPSFSGSEPVDIEVKTALIRDTFNILGINAKDRKKVLIGDKDRARKRLLKSINTKAQKIDIQNLIQRQHILERNFRREEQNLGGYRLIMPVISDSDFYSKFINHQDDKSSMFSVPFSTKYKQNVIASLRDVKKVKVKSPVSKPKCHAETEIPKKRFTTFHLGYLPNTIADWEEKERLSMMAHRHFLVESCQIRAAIRNVIHPQPVAI